MPGIRTADMAEGTYVFESFPSILDQRWGSEEANARKENEDIVKSKQNVRCHYTEYLKPLKKIPKAKTFRGGYLPPDLPPVAGRLHVDIQTDLYLEELVDKVELIDKCTQTDDFLNRPATPFFIPAKSGIDISTQVYEGDVFFFDIEVKAVVEVLCTKTIEQALLEVMEEEELANIRCEINYQGELRAAYLNEIMRREEQNKRYREEYLKRLKEARDLLKLKLETGNKIIINLFAHKLLEPLMPQSFENLYVNGYFRDPVEMDVRTYFMKDLLVETIKKVNPNYVARLVLDGIIREAVDQHRNEYSNY